VSDCPGGSRWREALALIGRRPVGWTVAVIVAGVALGGVLLAAIVAWSARPWVDQTAIAPDVTVVLASGTSPADAEGLRNALSLLPAVAGARFVPREAALAQIAQRTPADREAIGQLAGNPLPDVVVLSFKTETAPALIESTVAAIKKMARVEAVDLDLGWYRKLWAVARIGAVGLLVVAGALLLHAVGWLLVAVVVSGPIDPRRVRLLWMLGADDRGVRRAPIAAAALTALAVALIALLSARAGWQRLDRELAGLGQLYAGGPRLQWPPPEWIAGFGAAAVAIGLLIGTIRARLLLGQIRKVSIS
jgi:cell division transport system permease protein